MNNTDRIKEIIRDCGGSASIEEICKTYKERFDMIIFPEHISLLKRMLKKAGYEYDDKDEKW